jgi:hypothetical protein
VDNVSDLWPVLLTTAATLKYTYNPWAYMEDNGSPVGGSWNATQLSFLAEWSAVQYGAANAAEAAALYAGYFSIPHIVQVLCPPPPATHGVDIAHIAHEPGARVWPKKEGR